MRQIIDDDSDPFDRNGILKDGRGFTVKMLARDAAVAAKPQSLGQPRSIADEMRDAETRRTQARDAWVADLEWKPPEQRDTATAAPPHAPAPRPNSGNRPAAGQPVRGFADAQQARDRGYAEYCASLTTRNAAC